MCNVRKHVVYDFKKLSNWLKPDRTNISITNLVFFTSPRKLDRKLKIIQTQERFYENNSVNYLGFQIYKNLTWKQRLNHMAMKVNEIFFGRQSSVINLLNSIYVMLRFLGHKTLIKLKDWRKNLLKKKFLRTMFFFSISKESNRQVLF